MATNNQLNTPEPFAISTGGTGVTSVTTSPTASAWMGWDANKNASANSFIEGYRTTATAGATTTLTVGDAYQQFFTGSTTQTVVLPVTSTLALGQGFFIVNNSSGVVTVQSSGGNTIQAMASGTTLWLTCILTSGTTASSWYAEYTSQTSGANFPVNTNISSMTGLTGALQAPTGVIDANGNDVLQFISAASAVNFIQISNRGTGANPIIQAAGTDSAIGLLLSTKNSIVYLLDATSTRSGALQFRNAANSHYTQLSIATAQSTDVAFNLPAADGPANSTMISDGSGNLSLLATDPVIQRVSTLNTTSTTGSTVLPFDNTIPQNTEGDQYMTLAITPKNSANILVIEASLPVANTAASGSEMGMALFQDSTANALACTSSIVVANQQVNTHLRYVMTAGTTSTTTFKIRVGSNSAGTTTTNGISGGRIYGGVQVGSIIITEYTT